jgi:hypothetical protein
MSFLGKLFSFIPQAIGIGKNIAGAIGSGIGKFLPQAISTVSRFASTAQNVARTVGQAANAVQTVGNVTGNTKIANFAGDVGGIARQVDDAAGYVSNTGVPEARKFANKFSRYDFASARA